MKLLIVFLLTAVVAVIAAPGTITITNNALLGTRCSINFTVNNKASTESTGYIFTSFSKQLTIQDGATNVSLECELFSAAVWSAICTKTYDGPVNKTIKIEGSLTNKATCQEQL